MESHCNEILSKHSRVYVGDDVGHGAHFDVDVGEEKK